MTFQMTVYGYKITRRVLLFLVDVMRGRLQDPDLTRAVAIRRLQRLFKFLTIAEKIEILSAENIANACGCSRERARQNIVTAIRMARKDPRFTEIMTDVIQ